MGNEPVRKMLDSYISTMEYNFAQYERTGGHWPWPGTEEFARGRLAAYKEIRRYL